MSENNDTWYTKFNDSDFKFSDDRVLAEFHKQKEQEEKVLNGSSSVEEYFKSKTGVGYDKVVYILYSEKGDFNHRIVVNSCVLKNNTYKRKDGTTYKEPIFYRTENHGAVEVKIDNFADIRVEGPSGDGEYWWEFKDSETKDVLDIIEHSCLKSIDSAWDIELHGRGIRGYYVDNYFDSNKDTYNFYKEWRGKVFNSKENIMKEVEKLLEEFIKDKKERKERIGDEYDEFKKSLTEGKLKENDDPDYESEYAADLFKNALHREMNQNDYEAIESLLEEGLTYTEALEQYVHECVSKMHESGSANIQRLTEATLREWAVKDYFSRSELEKTDKLPDETLDDKIKIIEDAKAGDRASIMYLIIKNHAILGSYFVRKVMPFESDKDEAFDNFMLTVTEIMFNKGKGSIFNNFSVGSSEDPIAYFGHYLTYYLQRAYSDQRRESERHGVTSGRVDNDTHANLKKMTDLDSIGEIEADSGISDLDRSETGKACADVIRKIVSDSKMGKVIYETFSNYQNFSPELVAEKSGVHVSTVRKYLAKLGELLEAEGVRFDEFKSYVINNGLEDLLKETGIESKASFEPVVNKGKREVRKNNLEGLNATEIVDKFLHNNPKGTAATYKDFLKSDMYYDAASVVNMRNFNSAKARLKVAGKI